MSIKNWKDIVESNGARSQKLNKHVVEGFIAIDDEQMVKLLNASGYEVSLKDIWDVTFAHLTISGDRIVAVYNYNFMNQETDIEETGKLYVSLGDDGSWVAEY